MGDEKLTQSSGTTPSHPDGAEESVADDQFLVRRAKLAALRKGDSQPFRDSWNVTARSADLGAMYASLEQGSDTEDIVSVAGRLVAKRDQGKVAFLVIRDATGDLQLFCRTNVLGADGFSSATDLDLGDWVGAVGTVLRTRLPLRWCSSPSRCARCLRSITGCPTPRLAIASAMWT